MKIDETGILEHKMQSKIDMRLQSDVWDLAIAKRVLNYRRKVQASFISATAAIVLVIFAFLFSAGKKDTSSGGELYSFINSQVESTHKQVFKKETTNNTRSGVYLGYVSYDAVDNVIELSMAKRLSSK